MDHTYLGKVCPFCKTPFQMNDTVVFCNTCGMPQHLACWQQNAGCATYGCTGMIETIINQERAVQPEPMRPSGGGAFVRKSPSTRGMEVIYESSEGKLQENCEVLIEKVALIRDAGTGNLFVRCCFRSLTDVPVCALLVDVKTVDVWGKEVRGVEGFQFIDLNTKKNSLFGQNTAIPLPEQNSRCVDVVIRKVLFEGRKIKDCSEDFTSIGEQRLLTEFFGSKESTDEYIRETYSTSKYVPCVSEKIWRCSCGEINRIEDNNCSECKAERRKLMLLLDPGQIKLKSDRYLQQKIEKEAAERLERERQAREAEERLRKAEEEKERKKREALAAEKARKASIRKRVIGILLALLLTGGAVYGTVWHLVPYIRYTNAGTQVANHEYDKAYQTYTALGDYKDSSEKAMETLYQKGEDLFEQKKYDEAAAEFKKIPDYKNSSLRAEACRKEAVLERAIEKYDSGEYEEALKLFEEVGDVSKTKDWVNKTKYAAADRLFVNEEYDEAYEAFTAIQNYSDSKERAKESKYQMAGYAFKAEDYKTAYTYYHDLTGYKDSGEMFKESKYLYGIGCLDGGNYKEASDTLLDNNLKGYKERDGKYTEATYLYAKQSYESKKYDEAWAYFSKVKEYKDASELYQESRYQDALSLMKRNEFTKAISYLDGLGKYKDSKSKVKEAKYGYVKAHRTSTDMKTYEYLKELKANGYSDSAKIFKELYAWKVVDIYFNSSKSSTQRLSSISRYSPVYCHFTVRGGEPEGCTYIYCRDRYPDGSSNGNSKISFKFYNGGTGWFGWDDSIYLYPERGATGTLTMTFTDEKGNQIGSGSVKITR